MDKKHVDTPSNAEIAQLKDWAKKAGKEIQEVSEAMAPLQARLSAARERLDLVHRLLRLAAREEGTPDSDPSRSVAVEDATKPGTIKAHFYSVEVANLEDCIERVLDEAGKPIHIREIRQSLIDRGIPLPGRGDEANIIVRLSRAPDRFVRTGRGTYGLSSWGLEEVTPTRKKRLIRRRVKQ
ncbi:MAG: hypothetical protein ACE5OQ_11930 [Woeseia sp.]